MLWPSRLYASEGPCNSVQDQNGRKIVRMPDRASAVGMVSGWTDGGMAVASSAGSRMPAEQAITLDMIFSEMAQRMASNIGEYLLAMEIYSRIALKAQANSRATLEALAKLHQPREQTVRHVHVNEGGQAVIADEFHHHQTGGLENGESIEQPHATGTGAAGAGPALPCPDPIGEGLPIPSGEGWEAVPDARREG